MFDVVTAAVECPASPAHAQCIQKAGRRLVAHERLEPPRELVRRLQSDRHHHKDHRGKHENVGHGLRDSLGDHPNQSHRRNRV